MSNRTYVSILTLIFLMVAFSLGTSQTGAQTSTDPSVVQDPQITPQPVQQSDFQSKSGAQRMRDAWNSLEIMMQQRTDGGTLFDTYLQQLNTAESAGPASKYVYPANIIPNPAMGFNPNVNYTLPNYSSSPNIRKFIDKLPGLGLAGCNLGTPTFSNASCTGAGTPAACCTGAGTGRCVAYSDGTCGQNNLGQYIPVAQPDTSSFPGSDYYEIGSGNYSAQMNSDLPATALRGYYQTNAPSPVVQNVKQYLGPAIVARVWDPSKPAGVNGNGRPVRLRFTNNLPLSNVTSSCSTNPAGSPDLCLPVDMTLMGAGQGPLGPAPYGTTACDMGTAAAPGCNVYTQNRLTIPHLHGGRTPWISDGTPHQWITPAGDPIPGTVTTAAPFGMKKGAAFMNVPDMVNNSVVNGQNVPCIGGGKCFTPNSNDGMSTLFYSNEQSARLMFWHDHVYGITRLNVYKGVAAPYLLVDNIEDDLIDGSNVSGKNTWGASVLPHQPWAGAIYRYGIPLVIQDKSFVNDNTVNSPAQLAARNFPIAEYDPTDPTYVAGCTVGANPPYKNTSDSTVCGTDPLWEKYVGTRGGQLWMSHEYMPVENIYDPTGNTTNGRWDYGPFMIPPMIPTNLTLPSPTITPEAFGDTMVVNGTVYPYVELPPDIVRFRILSVPNDRVTNLQIYKADPLTIRLTNRGAGYTSAPAVTLTGGGGTYTSATATLSNGVITDITPNSNCYGFTGTPVVTITGGGGTCTRLITAIIPANSLGGSVTGFTGLIDPATGGYTCTGFTSAPTVAITGGGGVSCNAVANLIPPGQLINVTVVGAAGYTSAPTVGFTGGGFTTTASAVASANTEVRMVDAAPNPAFPTWPIDGRDGGVPDPTTQVPPWILIGNEGGLLAQASVIPTQPIDYEYVRQSIPFAGVTSHSLLLLPAQRADVLVDLRGAAVGDTYILYNDAPAPMPGLWPQNDYYTDAPDLRSVGGAPTTAPGFAPNTRTIMQIRIVPFPAGTSAYQSGVSAASYQAAVRAAIPKAFAVSNDPPIALQKVYNDAFPTGPYHATADTLAQSLDGILNLTGTCQPITRIKTVMPGNNYTVAPKVTIIGAPGDTPAGTATAGLNPIGGVTLLTAGTGYTTTPTCTLGAPGAGGVQATCVATISGGIVNAIQIDEPGSNYSTVTAPTCAITGGGGTGATCSTFVAVANTVGSITLPANRGCYMREPRVYITPNNANGMGATADALINGAAVMTGKNITEGFDPDFGRLDIRLGSTPNPLTPTVGAGMVMGLSRYVDPPTEILNDGQVTVWRLTHLGVDSHAFHFHLFDVQVVNRIDWTNVIKPPYPDELGWRDTIRTNPMEDIVVAFKPHTVYLPFPVPNSNRVLDTTTPLNSTSNFFPIVPPLGVAAVPQASNILTNFGWEYVYHCHMLSHEENDFMRPMVLLVPIPPAPTGLTYTVNGTCGGALSVVLNWTVATSNATSYTVQRDTVNTFNSGNLQTFTISGAYPVAPTYTDTTVAANIVYYYRVRANSASGSSAWSATYTVATVLPPTGFAANVTTGLSTDSALLTWTPCGAPAGGFTIQRLDFNSGLVTTNVPTPTATSYNSTNLTKTNTYWFRIRANLSGTIYSPWVPVPPLQVYAP